MAPPIKAELIIRGMYCENCAFRVHQALSEVTGVECAEVSLESAKAIVTLHNHPLTEHVESLITAVIHAGFHCGRQGDALHTRLPLPGATYTMALQDFPADPEEQSAIEAALSNVEGVFSASASIVSRNAIVRFDPALVEPTKFHQAVAKCGFNYTAQGNMILGPSQNMANLRIGGMTCATCSGTIERALMALPYVVFVSVNLATESAIVVYDERIGRGSDDLIQTIEDVGFEASVIPEPADRVEALRNHHSNRIKLWKRRLAFGVALTVPVFLLGMVLPMIHGALGAIGLSNNMAKYIVWAIATPVQFGVGATFYRSAYHALRNRSPDMSVLVVVGTTAAYMSSVVAVLLGLNEQYFDTSAVLVTFVVLGKFLETRAKGKTNESLLQLQDLQPQTASIVQFSEDGSELSAIVVQSVALLPGQIVKVAPGASIPCDGVILSGTTMVDESMLTGESVPVLKEAGAKVFGATINMSGVVYVTVLVASKDSMLSKIIHLVEHAQTTKPSIQKLVNRVSAVFVPVVLVISLITFLLWLSIVYFTTSVPKEWLESGSRPLFSLLFAIAVLVISCPCALGLATPTAIMVATGVGAKIGILFKGGHIFERASVIDTVIFDKTGTLTVGNPSVIGMAITAPTTYPVGEILWYAASAEKSSEHVLGKAIVRYAEDHGVEFDGWRNSLSPGSPDSFLYVPGKGIKCSIDGKTILVGNQTWLRQYSITASDHSEFPLSATIVYVAINSICVGAIALSDQPRPEATAAVAALKASGISVWMVTGDSEKVAVDIAQEVGVTNVLASALPAAKHAKVVELQNQGKKVCVVGDGINDSPALAQADCGIAIGSGTDIAIDAADIVLMTCDITGVITALELARVTLRRIKVNLMWAFLYNILGIPIAAGLLFPFFHIRLPPEVAGMAMALSSVCVVSSSLLLNNYRPSVHSESRQQKRLDNVVVHSTSSERCCACPSCQCGVNCQCTVDHCNCEA